MRVTVASSTVGAAAAAATALAGEIAAAVTSRGTCSIALSGGQTPWQMLEILQGKPVSWAALHVFQVDERAVPFDDERRNARRIRELLVRPGSCLPLSFMQCLSTAPSLRAAPANTARH
jgi:6-phosphogluconolactonase